MDPEPSAETTHLFDNLLDYLDDLVKILTAPEYGYTTASAQQLIIDK